MKRDGTVILITKFKGFTLAEIAIGILILGIMLSMGLKTAVANLDSAAYSETKSKQEQIKLALIGFLRTNGRLPCPDNALVTPNTGLESACVVAGTGYGIVPWAALGLSRDAVLDGWGNYFTYAVANVNPVALTPASPANPLPRHVNNNQNWTVKGGAVALAGFDIRSLIATTAAAAGFQTLWIQNRDALPFPNTEAFNAVVVILSHGKNGLGAKTTKVAARIPFPVPANFPDEVTNATIGSTTFVRRAYSDNAPVPLGGPYDDVVAYMTPQDLLQPLITEKTLLGQCQAYCTPAGAGCTPAAIPIGATPVTCP